ncbi:F-box protein PP2-A13 [Gossypium australe]|uniref:F-box protein PP2-A13 n=1 Tax=Gossypium australe TaxID=47621 RepID=A0A5B6W2G5_9ROSI|nr:F-box protein PP2-A13 [Gossypium australe]
MGANISGAMVDRDEGGSPLQPRLGDIPESCAALVLAMLDPPEICKLARVNRSFHGASSADFIWESKLPSNYIFIVEKVLRDTTLLNLQKKQLYAGLCRPNPFDVGRKEIWLDKNTGGVCLSISSKALTITGIDDRRYWTHISTEESRCICVYHSILGSWKSLNLIDLVCINADILDSSIPTANLVVPSGWRGRVWIPVGTYSLFFRLKLGKSSKRLGRRVCNSKHIHGWEVKPVRFQLTTSEGQSVESRCYLDNPGNWVLYRVGNFVVQNPNAFTNIKFSLTQIDCTHTKGGLCVDAALIYPTTVAKEIRSCS